MASSKIRANDFCWCKSGLKWKACHFPKKPPLQTQPTKPVSNIPIYNQAEIDRITAVCQLTAKILDTIIAHVKPNMTTKQIELIAINILKEQNAKSACLHYGIPPFPAHICTSVNNVVCHGIPSNYVLKDSDFVNIDLAIYHDGVYGDCSKTVFFNNCSTTNKKLIDVAEQCLYEAIAECAPNKPLHNIGKRIAYITKKQGFSSVQECCGHGIGLSFHHQPNVLHYDHNSEIIMEPGMIFTIEPMINLGRRHIIVDPVDRWTVFTADGKPSAQFEHTVLITQTGHKILTQY